MLDEYNNNENQGLEENDRGIMENNKNSQNNKEDNDKAVIKIILLSKKVRLGKKKFDKREIMIDAIANAYQLIKAQIKSGTIEGVQYYQNNQLIKEGLTEDNCTWVYILRVFRKK